MLEITDMSFEKTMFFNQEMFGEVCLFLRGKCNELKTDYGKKSVSFTSDDDLLQEKLNDYISLLRNKHFTSYEGQFDIKKEGTSPGHSHSYTLSSSHYLGGGYSRQEFICYTCGHTKIETNST